MSLRKIVCAVSLASGLALLGIFLLGSEVRAGSPDESPCSVDQATLAQVQSFDGEYVFVGGQKERDGLAAAIETSMEAVSPMVRGIGRKRLTETNPIPKRVTIEVEGENVNILLDGDGHKAGLGSAPIKTESSQGDKIKVSHRMRGSQLSQLIDGVGGDRRNDFKLNADGSRLTMDVEISSPQLPVSVNYKLTFKRQ